MQITKRNIFILKTRECLSVFLVKLWYILIVCVSLSGGIFADDYVRGGDAFLESLSKGEGEDLGQLKLEVLVSSADNAAGLGLFSLAESIYEKIIVSPGFESLRTKDDILMNLATVYIVERKLAEAREILSKVSYKDRSIYNLRMGLVALLDGKKAESEEYLKKVDEETLVPRDVAWLYIIKAFNENSKCNYKAAQAFLLKAQQCNVDELLRAEIDILLVKNKILREETSVELVDLVKPKLAKNISSKTHLKYALSYAVLLDQSGKNLEAIDFIKLQIQERANYGKEELIQYWLMLAILSNGNGFFSQKALAYLIMNDAPIANIQLVLSLLSHSQDRVTNPLLFKQFLDQLLTEKKCQVIHADLLLLRALVNIELKDWSGGEKDALAVLNDFSTNNDYSKKAIMILVDIALKYEPPQYRNAAHYLSMLETKVTNDFDRKRLLQWIADCYFLNNDYSNAASFYEKAIQEEAGLQESSSMQSQLIYQLIFSYIRVGDLEKAEDILGDSSYVGQMLPDDYWAAIWSLILFEKQKVGVEAAYDRILKLKNISKINGLLKYRFMWMEAQLTLEMKLYEKSLSMAVNLLELLNKDLTSEEFLSDKASFTAYTLLIQGQSLLFLDELQEAEAVFQILRSNCSDSNAAILSYIAEARYYAAMGRTVDAQQKLIELADKYKDNQNVPIALYEAAIQAEARGVTGSLREAVALLDRLCLNFPDNELVYSARIQQANILRKLNDFSSAQYVYDDLLHKYKDHPCKSVAMMGRAECLLAAGSYNELRYEDAAIAFERIFDSKEQPTALRIEAGYKWAYSLEMLKNDNEAQNVYWQVIDQFLISDKECIFTRNTGAYWMAKSIFSLGALLEKRNSPVQEIRSLYKLIIDYNLPGKNIAQSKLKY